MSWGTSLPLVDLVQHLVDTRLRSERIRLAQRLQSLEGQAKAIGVPAAGLKTLLKGVDVPGILSPTRIDTELVSPQKPAGVWRKRYLTVKTKPGSIF